MPRKFVDSLGPKEWEDETEVLTLLHMSKMLGFSQIWISNLAELYQEKLDQHPVTENIKVYYRLDIGLREETKDEILKILRKQRRNCPIIALTCDNADIASWAAQDNRIDILKFPILNFSKLFSRSVAKLMIKFNKSLEINLAEIYSCNERFLIPIFRETRQAISLAMKKHIPIIFSSGATNPQEVRNPRELVALAHLLSGDESIALEGLSSVPSKLLLQNLFKISPDYIVPGVYNITSKNMEEE
ncbi:MAG: RNase P subunit p30 family protein [Candidatus Hodarchaeales archaeon]